MKDLSLHLLDILENSAKAGARRVEISLVPAGNWLELKIRDDGPGLPAAVRDEPTDPFRTTRAHRPIGLGLPLLRAAAEQTGGCLDIAEPAAGGVALSATFNFGHIDAKPMGRIEEALMAAMLAWPAMDLVVKLGAEGREILNTDELRDTLEGVPLGDPGVQRYLRGQLAEELDPLYAWAGGVGGPGSFAEQA